MEKKKKNTEWEGRKGDVWEGIGKGEGRRRVQGKERVWVENGGGQKGRETEGAQT